MLETHSRGASPKKGDRMTFTYTKNNDKKSTVRKRKKKPRKPTYHETRANNNASARTGSKIFNIKSWMHVIKDELERMNSGKSGRPFRYCTSMILWIIAVMGYEKDTTIRKIAGKTSGILESHGLKGPHYSTVLRRVSRFMQDAAENEDWILSSYVRPNTGKRKHRVAVDSTGLNLSKTTLWRENKWGVGPKRRGWLKLHAMVDIDSGEILAYVLTDDRVGDNRAFIPLMDLALSEKYNISTVFADNAYEAIDNWKMLHSEGIKFVVRFKSNTVPASNGCLERGESAGYWVVHGPEKWKKYTDYGMRWKAECAFSDFKRLEGETISATTQEGMEREVKTKVLGYNRHKRTRADMIGITGNEILVAED